jgi:hypothetical protein
MIEANELRVGNYVNHNNFKVPMMVSGLILEDRRFRVAVIGSNSTLMCGGSWSAIPLTEQWLIDFGFKRTSYGREFKGFHLEASSRVLATDVLSGFSWEQVVDEKYLRILHVHQLQNLYFALTGIELIKQ